MVIVSSKQSAILVPSPRALSDPDSSSAERVNTVYLELNSRKKCREKNKEKIESFAVLSSLGNFGNKIKNQKKKMNLRTFDA